MMQKGEIIIDEKYCKGCGYCTSFCSRNCLVMSGNKVNNLGYILPVFSEPAKCNGCGICGWLCPALAIEVYKYTGSE